MKPPRPPRLSISAPAVISGLILLTGAAVTLALNLPGHLSYDSIVQLDQGRRGVYNFWHPPVMAWLLGLADAVRPGTALFVIFDVLLVFGGLASFAVLAARGAWGAPVAALAIVLLPQAVIYPAIVWKDVLFAGAALCGFACLALAARAWSVRPWRWALIAKAVGLFTLAALARQNGAVIVPFAAVVLAWIAARQRARPLWGRSIAQAAAFTVVVTLLTVGATAALKTHGDGQPEGVHQFEDLRIYEIVAARADDPRAGFPILAAKTPALNAFLTTQGRARYKPSRIDPLVQTMGVQDHEHRDSPFVREQWKAIFLADPLLYLKVRAKLFGWVFFTPDLEACVPVAIGVDGPRDVMARLGMETRYSDTDDALMSYASAFFATPAFSHAAYAALALALLVALLVRRRPEDIAVAGLLAASLAFTATFFVITIACDYRYLYFLDLSALAGGLYVAGTLAVGRRDAGARR